MENEIKKKRILHVDDEHDILEVVKTILESEGYDVVSEMRGEYALTQIEKDGFDLLILDIMMPDMSGWELFNRIRTIKPDYKVIFLTILDLPENKIKELLDAGIKDYIKKPFDREDFIARVKKAMENK